nr:DUF3048 domain-containing protein [Oscillospiraceae bacterium]
MNNKKTSNLLRLIAFFLTTVILVCTFGFTVDGWTLTDNRQDNSNANVPGNNQMSDNKNPDGNPDSGNLGNEIPDEPQIYIPEYTNPLTGLETTEELSKKSPLAFIMDGNKPLFGVSDADILCEIPVEDGNTRLITFISSTDNLWKIGSFAPCRGYIGNVIKYFGGIAVSAGYDDFTRYASCDLGNSIFDLTVRGGYYYTEHQDNFYTNKDLLDAGLSHSGIHGEVTEATALPYVFTDFGEDNVIGDTSAKEISITQSRDTNANLSYDETTKLYALYKNNSKLCDTLSGNQLEFTNCFVLFADSVTYDKSEYSQIVVDTIGSGKGYYFTEGTATEIYWTATAAGLMTFYSAKGEKLTVNRGSSYICYMKSSKTQDISFS